MENHVPRTPPRCHDMAGGILPAKPHRKLPLKHQKKKPPHKKTTTHRTTHSNNRTHHTPQPPTNRLLQPTKIVSTQSLHDAQYL